MQFTRRRASGASTWLSLVRDMTPAISADQYRGSIMPKNSKGGSIRIPNLTPAQVRPGVSQQTGIGGGVPAPEPLILHLDRLRIDVVRDLSEGDPVILQIDDLPIVATTLLGQVIGQVRLDDVEEVRNRRIRRATVIFAETDPLRCTLEAG